ncbi:molecular chaperone TorD family protein [uncultured Helicobacter sp.]|uniref:molecular chaperone TorD family protein n=1 Tax=uncultured Helicobacter sp. TaxID=175537 RepID=UPI0026296418|nr:molecular chaperone TorD family protein [uncultured Helicobacter sp.]
MAHNVLESIANARALYYDFFAGLFLYELLCKREETLIKQVEILKTHILSENDDTHFEVLANALKTQGIKHIIEEYTTTFILPFTLPSDTDAMPRRRKKGEVFYHNTQIMLYLSHYWEGCLNGKALLKSRELIKQSTFRLDTQGCKESEEHLGFLLLLMRHLVCSQHSEDEKVSWQVLRELVIPLGDFVIEVLQKRENLLYYTHIASLLQSFLNVERNL